MQAAHPSYDKVLFNRGMQEDTLLLMSLKFSLEQQNFHQRANKLFI